MANRKVLRIKRANIQPIAADSSQPVDESGYNKSVDRDESIAPENDNGNGSENPTSDFVNPELIAGEPDTSDSTPIGKRKRGRPAGSTNKTKSQKTASNLESILFSLHAMGAAFIVPELELSRDESANLAAAISEVNALYPVQALSPEVMAWINLLIVGCGIYGPRFMSAKLRIKKEAEEKKQTANQPVLRITPAPMPAPMGVN